MVRLLRRPITAATSLFDTGFDPARARKLLVKNEIGESNVRGLYLAGEIAGTPLIKLGLNRGRAIVDHIAAARTGSGFDPSERSGEWLDVLIVGAGSAGHQSSYSRR